MMNMETLKLDVDLKELHTLTDFIGQYSKDLQAKLVIEEIFVNIVNYSNADYIIVNVESHKNLEIEFVDNGGSYIFDLPTTNLSVEGTLCLYYDNNGEVTKYETGSELYEVPTDYTWYFVYDVANANYEDYRWWRISSQRI